MVLRLEDLSGIQVAIVYADELKFKRKIFGFPVRDLNHKWYSRDYDYGNKWFKSMEKMVSESLQKFPWVVRDKIPTPIIISCLEQSLRWTKLHNEIFDLSFNYGYHFLRSSFFTPKGMINKELAARELVKDTEIESSLRYCIACYYCFSDVIPALWDQLPEYKKPKIENGIYEDHFGIGQYNEMVILWSHYMLGELQSILSPGETFALYQFKKSLENGNDVAFKYCFEELNEMERKEAVIFCRNELKNILNNETFSSLRIHSPVQPYINMVILLLSHLDEEQLRVFIQPHKMFYLVLHNLLYWPHQHSFMNIVNRFQEKLSKIGFYFLLNRIVSLMNYEMSCKFCNYHLILRDFCVQNLSLFKSLFFRIESLISSGFSLQVIPEEKIECILFKEDFTELVEKSSFVISELFKSSLTIEIEEIIRLILGSATLEEKSSILESQYDVICKRALKFCDLRKINLFIEYCVPKEGVEMFKRKLVNEMDVKNDLQKLILNGQLKQLQKILNWALCGEEIKEWLQSVLLNFGPMEFLSCNSNQLKCIDKSLEWSLSSNEIRDLKKRIVLDDRSIVDRFRLSILKQEFQEFDFYLHWIFSSSEIDVRKVKKNVAFLIIDDMDDYFISQGLKYVKKFVKFIAFSPEECKNFKRHLVVNNFDEKFSRYVVKKLFCRIEEFIRWAELTESEVKHLKTNLVFCNLRFHSWIKFIVNGKASFVKKLLNWAQLSEEEVMKFYSVLLKEIDEHFNLTEKRVIYFYFTKKETKLVNMNSFLNGIPLPEAEIKLYKKNLVLKTGNIIAFFAMNDMLDEADELLNSCCSSKKEISEVKRKIFLTTNICSRLISRQRLDNVDKFISWTGINFSLKMKVLKQIIFHKDFYIRAYTNFHCENKFEILLNCLFVNDILLNKWKDRFLNWHYEREGDVEKLSKIGKMIDEYICRSKDKRKRKREHSPSRNTREKKICYCC